MGQSIPVLEVAEQKASLRNRMIASLKTLNNHQVQFKSDSITENILSSFEFQKAGKILIFISLITEVQTDLLIKKIFEMGKRVFIPIVDDKDLLVSELLNPNVKLVKGIDGIRVPGQKDRVIVSPDIIDLVIVPGLAFTREGARLGRGKGFYDKLLAGHSAVKVGIAFGLQVIDFIPLSQHDVGMDKVITESEIFNC